MANKIDLDMIKNRLAIAEEKNKKLQKLLFSSKKNIKITYKSRYDKTKKNLRLKNKRIEQLELDNKNKDKIIFQLEKRIKELEITSNIAKYNQKRNKQFNIGEKDEIKCIQTILCMKKKELTEVFNDIAACGVELINADTNKHILDESEIKKSSCANKADIVIKFKKTNSKSYCSIKSFNGGCPSIINHTSRKANVFQKGFLKNDLNNIDKLIKEYINKRKSNEISQDIILSKLKSINNNKIKKSIVKMIYYFMFAGTGRGNSKTYVDSLIILNKSNIKYIHFDNTEKAYEYCESILHRCILSLRSKGMPKEICKVCEPWVYKEIDKNKNTRNKGSIHIRIRKI